jgi:subtilisin family serine protease
VLLHANGFEVDSSIPGGGRLKMSGTSMASPNAANLAAKILAVNPKLSPPQVIAIMRETSDTTADGRRFLIDPKKAIAKAEQTQLSQR